MKVLHVAEVTHGGVVSLIRTFAELQRDAAHDVHVLAHPDTVPMAGTRHDWEPVRRSPRALLAAGARLREVVRSTQPDVVHLHSFFPGLLGRSRPLPAGPGVVYQPHSFAFDAVPSRLTVAVTGVERWASRFTDHMVTNCGDERDEGAAHGVRIPTTVVGLPLELSHFAPFEGDRTALRRQLGITAGFVAVCVGRISRQKGQRELAAAWESAAPEDSLLVFVGPGDPSEIATAAPTAMGRSIICTGGQEDVRPWLWAATVSVLPSLYEGQSVAMAEALACGLPVVMTDVNGAREAVCPRGQPSAGAVVPVADLEELLRQLERRRLAPALVAAESAAARSRSIELFDSARVMQRLEAAYVDAIARATRRRARRSR